MVMLEMEFRLSDVRKKIELLCLGLRRNIVVDEVYDKQNPYDLTRTGNVGLQLQIGAAKIAANVPVLNKFCDNSPYSLGSLGKDYFLVDDRGSSSEISIIQSPSWYMESLGSGCYAGQYLLQEGVDTLIASITDSCGYVTNGTQCRFCAISHNSKNNVKESPASRKNHIKDALRLALQDVKKYASVNLTGGNTFTPDHGALGYIEFIEAIRNVSDIPICIEMSPPDNIIYLKKLHDAGASAVMMNIEMWNEDDRKYIMPGKSVIQKADYMRAWEDAVRLFGSGNVSSVIIAGLEDESYVREAIVSMTEVGVIPSIMPFRPNDGSAMQKHPTTNPDLVEGLSKYAAEMIIKKTIPINNLPGCIGCGACSVELDFAKLRDN